MGCVNSITSMAVNTVTQAFGHTGSRPRGFDSGLSLFVKVQNWDAAALRYSAALIVDSITSKAVKTVAHSFWYKSTQPDRPCGFDSGRPLVTKVQNGNAAALRYSVTWLRRC
jgi:hypothetical protein